MAVAAWVVPLVLAVVGAAKESQAQRQAGKTAAAIGQAQRGGAEFEAQLLEQRGGQEIAASQRAAAEERRQARYGASRAVAVAAASGAGGPTVSRIISDIAGEGAYRSAVALYEGEERARQTRLGAISSRYEGEVAAASGQARQRAFNIGATSSVLRAGSSLLDKYGRGGPWRGRGDSSLIREDVDTGSYVYGDY